ncbi:MAG TPA: terminase family protein [Stellaceae bacterium]|nr:terminase family protein [Stellaceae bacterium]
MSAEMKKPTKAQKEDLLAVMKAKRQSIRDNRLRDFEPYPIQREFISATGEMDVNEVCFRAGNQQGKSLTAGYLTSVWATGMYPENFQGRVFNKPTRSWVVGESMAAVRDTAQRYLLGIEGGDPGLIPEARIIKKVLGHGAGGGLDKVFVRHLSGGVSEVGFKSYDQDVGKLASATLDFVWTDEEPPLAHYSELLARTISTRGVIICSMTPLSGMGRILGRFTERTADAIRTRRLIHGRASDALHLRDPKELARLMAMFPEWQRRARMEGLPMFGGGAVFEDLTWEDVSTPLYYDPYTGQIRHPDYSEPFDTTGVSFLIAIDFGYAHPFGMVLLMHDRDNDVIYVLGGFKMSGAIPPVHASRIRAYTKPLGNIRVAWPHDGSGSEKGDGEVLMTKYRAEGLDMLPTHATHAKIGGYGTEAGIVEMMTRFKSGRLKVSSRFIEWRGEFEQYHRKDDGTGKINKVNDDLLSATRIGVMQIRSAKPPMGTYRGVEVWRSGGSGDNGGTRPYADGLNFNLFDPSQGD